MVALKVECSVVQKVALKVGHLAVQTAVPKVGHLVVHSVDLMAVHWAVYLVVQKVDLLEHPHNYYYRSILYSMSSFVYSHPSCMKYNLSTNV